MAEYSSALTEFLENPDDEGKRARLGEVLEGVDLATARVEAKEDPASAEAAAKVIGRLILEDAPDADVVDGAKALAQRAPRDATGNDVALLTGIVAWRKGGQPQVAEPYFRRVRRHDAANGLVLDFYRELFSAETQGTQLMQVLVQARRATKDPELRFSLAEEMAALAERRLGSADRAIEVWRSVVREDGKDPRATEALERLYRETGKWTALVELLKEEVESLEQTAETAQLRIEKLLEIVALYRNKLKLDAMALATLQRILEIDPGHEASLEALAETYASAGRWNDLLGVYARRVEAAEKAQDTRRHVELLCKVAEVWMDRLGNPQRALEPLNLVLAIAKDNQEARDLLAKIHEQRHDWRALIALRREELEGRSEEEAVQLRIELARLAEERLGDRREAIAAWNDVLEHHGDVDVALQALARLYERESRWAESAEICHRRIAASKDTETAVGLLTRLGSIYSDRLRNRDEAVRVWAELVRIVPGHDKGTRMLRDAYVADSRWDDLHDLYESQNRLQDLVDVLQSAADRIQDIEERVALYRRVASLCRERLGQPERGLKALERTLAIQPTNFAVARELIPMYREQGNWARLLGTYEILLGSTREPEEQLVLVAAMRDVAEHKLGSPTLTLQWSARAYRIRPTDENLRNQLETAAENADGWDELTRIFEERIDASVTDDDERLLLLEKLAVVARDKLFKPDDAQRYFRRIIELEPTNGGAMAALEDIYSSMRRWDDLSDVYRRRLDVTEDPEARLQTLRGMARIQEQHLGDLDGATASHEAVLEIQPDDSYALDKLASIHRNRGNWEALADVLQRQLDRIDSDSARLPVMFELAQVHATRLRNSERAIEGFLAVLADNPAHRETVEALEALRQADPTMSVPIMRGLLPYYRRTDDRIKEAEAMEVLVAAEEDDARRLELLDQLSVIYEKTPDRQADAMRIRMELLRVRAGDYQNRQLLRRVARDLGRVEEVAAGYEELLRGLAERAAEAEQEGHTLAREDATLRRDLHLELGAILRDDLARPLEAERAFREVLHQEETHQGAYSALEALLRGRSAHEELVRLYRRRVDAVFNQREQKELLGRIIDISRNVLGDRATAVRTAEELLDLIPDDITTIELLAQLYGEGGDLQSQEEILGRWAELVDDVGQRNELRCRRAELRIQHLQDTFGAVDLLGQVVGEDPDHAHARALLEQLLAVDEVQLAACALLEPIYIRANDHDSRIRVLHVRRAHAENVGSIDEAVSHLVEIARLEEQQRGNLETAFAAVREAYLMDPARVDTRREVERLGIALARERDLVEVWRAALASEKVTDSALKIDLTRQIAATVDERLGDAEAARQAYSDLLALDPSDAKLAHKAVSALCRLHLEAGDGVALIEAQRALLRFTDSVPEQVRIRLEIAMVQEQQLGDRVGAALTYGEVLDMQSDNEVALDALERLFLEEEEWERLCDVLEHRIGVTGDPRAKPLLWRQIGEIQRDQIRDPQRAIEAFQSILDLKVGRDDTVAALRALVALYGQLERWVDVDEGLRRLISLADRDADRVELLSRAAEVVGRRLDRGQDALELLKRVLDLAPTEGRARNLVTGYLEQDDTREQAIRILMPLYEAEQNWPALVGLEELQARHQPSGRRRLRALLQVAKTHEERLRDPTRAFAVLCDALTEAADQPELAEILEKVERLGADQERTEALVDAYASTVDRILDSELQHRVLLNLGEASLERLGRLNDARMAFTRVLDLKPDDLRAVAALERIYLRQDDHEALAQLLVRSADRAQSTAERDASLTRAADIYRAQLDRPEEAITLYERLSSEGLMQPEVQEVLEPLYERTERHRELAAHLNRKLASLAGSELCDTHLRLGRLYGEKLDDPEEGMRHLSVALRLDPDHAVATEELNRYLEDESLRRRAAEILEPVFAAVHDWHRLVRIQEIRLADSTDPEDRLRILLRIAQIEEDQLEDLETAFESYARVFKEHPRNAHVRDQLNRLANVLGHTERYAEILTGFATEDAASDDSEAVLSIVRQAADLWAGPLNRPPRAIPLYERLLAAQPDDSGVFAALEHALTRAEMWQELEDAYWREVDTALDEDRQVELLRKLASLATDRLESPEGAARAYRRLLEVRPGHDFARAQLEAIFRETGRYNDLIDLLRDRLDRLDDPLRRIPVHLQIADVQARKLEDIHASIDTIEALLAESPGSPAAVTELERIAEKHKDHRSRVIEILRPIYEQTGNNRRLVDLCEWHLSVTDDPVTRHEVFREMAALHAREHGGAEQAFRVLARALAEPGPEDALKALDQEIRRIADLLRTPGALSDALVIAADAEGLSTDVDRRMQLLVRAAGLQLEIGEPVNAADILRSALEISERHEAALTMLDQALSRLGYHEELRHVLARRVKVSNDDRERVEILRRLGRLLEDTLMLMPDAERVWRELLDIEPSDQEALKRLSKAYEASGSTTELVDVLERQIDGSPDATERRELRMQLASVLRETVKDRSAEIDVLRSLLSESPTDDEALAALGRALVAEELFADAADVIQERASLATDDERKAKLLLETARLYWRSLEDVPSALERYESVLQLVQTQDGALVDLVELAQQPDASEAAAALVVPRLDSAGRFAELAKVHAARARLTQDPDERIAELRKLARVRADRLDDPQGSLEARMQLVDLVEVGQLTEALGDAARLAISLEQVDEHIEALGERSRSSDRDPEARIMLARVAARLAESQSGGKRRALDLLTPLLDAEIADKDVCAEMERLCRETDDKPLAQRVLVEAARLTTDPAVQADTLVRLGAVQMELDELGLALDAYRDALDLVPTLQTAIDGLEQILSRQGDEATSSLLDVLESAYRTVSSDAGQAEVARIRLRQAGGKDPHLLESLAQLCERGGGTAQEAAETWGRLLALDGENAHALDRLVTVAREHSLLEKAADLLMSAVQAAVDESRSAVTLDLQTASILLRDLNDGARATRALMPVLDDQPDHLEALELLVAAARKGDDPRSLHEALVRAAGPQPNPEASVALLREAATVAEQQLGEPALAIKDLESAIDLDDSDAEAWEKLLALIRASEDYVKLADALGRRVMTTHDPAERRDVRYRLANVLVDKLDRAEDALMVYQDMVGDQPDDIAAMQELEVLLRRLERWRDVQDVLERRLDVVEGDERIVTLEAMARLAVDRLDDPGDAIERLRQVLMEQPSHDRAEAGLEKLLTAEERWEDLGELLRQRVDRMQAAANAEGFRKAASSLAELLAERLGDTDGAQEILNRLLEVDPGYVPAILALASVYEVRGDEGAMRLTLQRAADQDPKGAIGAMLQIRLARLTDQSALRREHLERALKLDPTNKEAASTLLELARQEERWDQVVYLLELAAGRTDDEAERRDLTLQRVDLLLERLDNADAALQILHEIYQTVQDDVTINRRIADALFLADRRDEAAGMYNWLVEIGRQDKRSRDLAHDLTRLARLRMKEEDSAGARELLLEAYRVDTTNVETLMALGTQYENEKDWGEALKIYRTMLLQNAEKSGLLRRGDIYMRLAEAHVALDEMPKALAMLRRGVEEDRDHPDLARRLKELD